MRVDIPDQITKQIEAALAQQQIPDAEVESSINRIVERVAADDELLSSLLSGESADKEQTPEEPSTLPYDQWRTEFRAFLTRQKPRNPNVDDSRESIYFGP